MEGQDLGDPRLEYRPLPASPIAIAVLLITVVVALVGVPFAILNGFPFSLWGFWAVPPLLVLLGILLNRPSPLRLYEEGLELPLPLWQRLAGARRARRYEDIANVYPRLYYVSGALLSPFAASRGTVEHLGLGLETADGREVVLRFVPGVPRFSEGQDAGYRLVSQELREIFAGLERPWVNRVPDYDPEEIRRMRRQAARPLMPFPLIVLGFFAPLALLPALYLGLVRLGVAVTAGTVLLLLAVSVSPTLAMLLTSWQRSRRRRHYLNEISKHAQHLREVREGAS